METNDVSFSNDDDRRLFDILGCRMVDGIIRIKHNDSQVRGFSLNGRGRDLDVRACRRLGHILSQNTKLLTLQIVGINFMDVLGLCEGLQNN